MIGAHIAVAVICGLGLGNTRRAAAVHGSGEMDSTTGMRMAAATRSRKAGPSSPGIVISRRPPVRARCADCAMPQECLATRPGNVEEFASFAILFAIDGRTDRAVSCGGPRMFGEVAQQPDHVLIEQRAKRIVHRLQFHLDERVFEARNTAAIELIAEPIPGLLGRSPLLVPVHQDVALVGMQMERETALGEVAAHGAGIQGR